MIPKPPIAFTPAPLVLPPTTEVESPQIEVNRERIEDPIVEDFATVNLQRFELLALQSYWAEDEVKDGVELTIDTFEHGGIEYYGYATLHSLKGIDYLTGFLQACYSVGNEYLMNQVKMAECSDHCSQYDAEVNQRRVA